MLEKKARKCSQDSLLPFSPTINHFIHTRKKMRDEERFKSPGTYIVTIIKNEEIEKKVGFIINAMSFFISQKNKSAIVFQNLFSLKIIKCI